MEAYVIIAIAVLALGFGAGYKVESWKSQDALEALQAADATDRANALAVAAKAYQGQLAQAQATSSNNSQVIARLQNENAAIASDRDANLTLARRLLANAAKSSTSGRNVPKAAGGQGAAGSGAATGTESVARLLAATGDECDHNADQLDALIAEISPQL